MAREIVYGRVCESARVCVCVDESESHRQRDKERQRQTEKRDIKRDSISASICVCVFREKDRAKSLCSILQQIGLGRKSHKRGVKSCFMYTLQ